MLRTFRVEETILVFKTEGVGELKKQKSQSRGLNIFNGVIKSFLPKLGLLEPWRNLECHVSFDELIQGAEKWK